MSSSHPDYVELRIQQPPPISYSSCGDPDHAVTEEVTLEEYNANSQEAESPISIYQAGNTTSPPPPPPLTFQQKRNLLFLVLGFSCVVAGMTLIVGTGAIVIRSVGGTPAIAPMALACFFVGMSVVSLTLTHWFFERFGRTIGFWCGCLLTMTGSVVGGVGVWMSSSVIVLLANAILGAGAGMGMYLRFASVEVVPQAFASKAVTWTLCGGCLAAFVGPEVAAAMTGVFGDDHMTYFGVFLVTLCFAVAQAVFVGLIKFEEYPKSDAPKPEKEQTDIEGVREHATEDQVGSDDATLTSLLKQPKFLLPLFVSVLSWSIMAQPMSIFRVVMRQIGFTDRQSLTVIEFHFLSMYSPGFFSGWFIKKYGTIRSTQVAVSSFLLGTVINLSTQDNTNTTASWFLGLIFLGMGWNFGFSGATVWVTKVYDGLPQFKSRVQAANEAGTFFFSGMVIFSTGYIYDAGGAGLNGWRTLNYFLLGLIATLAAVVAVAMKLDSQENRKRSGDLKSTLDRTVGGSDLLERSQDVEV